MIIVDSDKLYLARQVRYLGIWVRNDRSWGEDDRELYRKIYYHFHMVRRLKKNLPSALLLNTYQAYAQSKIDYELSIYGSATEVNFNRVHRIQNLLARIICNNFDYIHSRGIDIVRSLKLRPYTRKTRPLSVCFNVQMYSWPRTSLFE